MRVSPINLYIWFDRTKKFESPEIAKPTEEPFEASTL
jgi:hypothetical protein